jgi:hypothetical protein
MHESVISISSLIEICEAKAIASGFKKGHQRTLEPYQNSRIECLARSIFCYVLTGRVDVRHPQKNYHCVAGRGNYSARTSTISDLCW